MTNLRVGDLSSQLMNIQLTSPQLTRNLTSSSATRTKAVTALSSSAEAFGS